MGLAKARQAFSLILFSLFFPAVQHEARSSELSDGEFLRIWRSEFECVRQNLNRYLNNQEPPYVIVFPGCPETDPDKALLGLYQNNMFDRRPINEVVEQDLIATTIIAKLTFEELVCLIRRDFDESVEILIVKKSEICE